MQTPGTSVWRTQKDRHSHGGTNSDSHKLLKRVPELAQHEGSRHERKLLPLGQPGVARWLISTSRHELGCNQSPHARGPKYLQGARESDRR